MMEKHINTDRIFRFPIRRGWVMMVFGLILNQGFSQSARSFESLSPEQSLRSTSLSSVQFSAYSDRALEKIEEWLTYMSLLRESREDSLLYAELSGYASELYLDPDVSLIFGNTTLDLESWLQANREVGGGQVFVSRHEWIDEWTHNGFHFERHLMVNLAVLEGESLAWTGERILTIYLTRIKKDFGGETVETWEIRLGGME